MTRATKRSHKHFQLDSAKIKRAQKALHAKTETEAIEHALDFAIAEHGKNRLGLSCPLRSRWSWRSARPTLDSSQLSNSRRLKSRSPEASS